MIRRIAAGIAVSLLMLSLTPGTAKGTGDGRTSLPAVRVDGVQRIPERLRHVALPQAMQAASRDWLRPALKSSPPVPPVHDGNLPTTRQAVVARPAQDAGQVESARSPGVVEGEATASGLGAPMRYALQLVGAAQFACLRPLWARESGWRPTANNPRSTAFGIAQLLTETSTDWRQQVTRGVAYIRARYGSACVAWAFWKEHLWY